MFIQKYLRSCAVLLTALVLTACEEKPSVDEKIFTSQTEGAGNGAKEQSNSLSKVADRSGIQQAEDDQAHFSLSEVAKPFIGRYKVKVDCLDGFVLCSEGEADFILTLLEDGTTRRSVVQTGNVAFDTNWHYRKDSWSYDEIHHQIVVHRDTGVEFFYNVTDEYNLIMDLEKVINGTEVNREYFAAGNPTPTKAYVLKKVS